MYRHTRRPISRAALLLLLPLLFLLTAPLPLPKGVAEAVPMATSALPTARIALSTSVAAPSSPSPSEIPAPSATMIPSVVPSTTATDEPSATIAPSATIEPSSTPVPSPNYVHVPSATLPARLDIVPTPTSTELVPTLPPAVPSAAPEQAPPGVRVNIPTLMYHYVRIVDQASDPLGFNLSVTPEHFHQQLDWLVERGYATVHMKTLAECVSGTSAQPCPTHAVALTFDDGYADAFTEVLPALRQRGMVATFYIISGFVGQPGYLTWDEVRALRDAGMEIGSHTVNHPDLSTLGYEQARAEIVDSRAQIESQLNMPVVSFCYPSGRFNPTVVSLVREAGYTSATTTMPNLPQSDLLLLPRLRVEGRFGLAEFQGLVHR